MRGSRQKDRGKIAEQMRGGRDRGRERDRGASLKLGEVISAKKVYLEPSGLQFVTDIRPKTGMDDFIHQAKTGQQKSFILFAFKFSSRRAQPFLFLLVVSSFADGKQTPVDVLHTTHALGSSRMGGWEGRICKYGWSTAIHEHRKPPLPPSGRMLLFAKEMKYLPATRSAGHGRVEGLLKAGGAEGAGLIRAAGDDGAVRNRRLRLATGQVCIQRSPLLFMEATSSFSRGNQKSK